MTTKGKIITWTGVILALALAGFLYIRFYFVFGDGVKAGELNQFIYKGYVWKTYEGKLIQAGFRGSNKNTGGATVESYIFDFSVEDEEVANELMRCSGKSVELHYKEYLGTLPWGGCRNTSWTGLSRHQHQQRNNEKSSHNHRVGDSVRSQRPDRSHHYPSGEPRG